MNLSITKYCRIKEKQFSVNGEVVFQNSECNTVQEFLTALYRHNNVNYPKFFKMDNLSKTGFLAVELLLQQTKLYNEDSKKQTGIFISNSSSSLDSDILFQQTIGEEYFPSPSVFVYTLPNIVMGEIAIKHKIYGETTFFVSESFDCKLLCEYVKQTYIDTNLQHAIVGWVEFYKQKCEAFVMLVEKENSSPVLEFSEEIIQKLYKS